MIVQPEAQQEAEEVRDHYDDIKPGLGDRFIAAFDDRLALLEHGPKFASERSRRLRSTRSRSR